MRVAVTGGDGRLGRKLTSTLQRRGHDVFTLARAALDITDPAAVRQIADWRPDVVVNAAAWTDVDGCAREPARAMLINADGAELVARAASTAGASVVQISTNEVFPGTLHRPYREDDEVEATNPYGASKLRGELAVRAANPRHLVVRTAWLFGNGRADFVSKILAAAEKAATAHEPLQVVTDEWGNPTWVDDLADRVAGVVERRLEAPLTPTLHLCGEPPASRYRWAEEIVHAAGLDVGLSPVLSRDFPRSSTPPLRAILDTGTAASVGVAPIGWVAETARHAARLRPR